MRQKKWVSDDALLQLETKTIMISDLPRDLVDDILSRIPLKSMRAMRLTFKKWNTLCKRGILTTMRKAREWESRFIVLTDSNLYIMSLVFNGVDVDPSIEPKDDITKVVVCNPYLGQTRWIKTRNSDRSMLTYAIGYEKKTNTSCRNHKILRFVDDCLNNPKNPALRYEIYDFESELWKTLVVTPHWCISVHDHGVSLKGDTYRCASERNSLNGLANHIISFDFTRERFGPLLHLPSSRWCRVVVALSCVGEEKLAFLSQSFNPCFTEIWITTKIESKEVLWSKFLRVDFESLCDLMISGKSFLIDEEKKMAMISENDMLDHTVYIIGEAGYFRIVDLGEPLDKNCWPLVCSYVPSLVQIKFERRPDDVPNKLINLERPQYVNPNMLKLAASQRRIKQEEMAKKRKRYFD